MQKYTRTQKAALNNNPFLRPAITSPPSTVLRGIGPAFVESSSKDASSTTSRPSLLAVRD